MSTEQRGLFPEALYAQALFKLEQEEYDKENINWSKIAFKDNQVFSAAARWWAC